MNRPLLYDPTRLAERLGTERLDALVAVTAPNVRYLTRFGKAGTAVAVVTAHQPAEPVLVLSSADIDFLVEDLADGVRPLAYGEFFRFRDAEATLQGGDVLVESVHGGRRVSASRAELVAEVLRAASASTARIGIDAPSAAEPGLVHMLPGASFVDVRPLVRELRTVKTAAEIERLRRAAAVTESAISATVDAARDGVTQAELAAVYGRTVIDGHAAIRMDNVSVGASTALGNVNVPDAVLRPGDILRFDVGAIVEGYQSDLSRCYSLGDPADKARRYHAAVVEGQRAALDLLRPGVPVAELFAAAVAATRSAGLPHYDRTHVGHGIGIAGDGYDPPILSARDATVVEAGMVLCVETPYYELGFAGLQVEDMVVVTDDGWEALSHLPRDLGVLPAR